MRILVSVPSIPYSAFKASKAFDMDDFLLSGKFTPTLDTMDVFPKELGGINLEYMWGINIPHWPMAQNGTMGVAGPGQPQDELFCPATLKRKLSRICYTYDKWRPYPAEAISTYTVKMAKKFAYKRCRLFQHAAVKEDWLRLFYVEHAPSSLAHLSVEAAMEVAEGVMSRVATVSRSQPNCPVLVFSPYGVGKAPGFFVSNGVGLNADADGNWDMIRTYLKGD